MQEHTFFEYEDVKVTNARFISGSQTYAMSNITSVKPLEQKPSRLGGLLILLVGLIMLTTSAYTMGAIVAMAAIVYLCMQKTVFHILLSTSGGDTKALKTYQRNYLNQVVAALNQAIVYRG